MDSSLEKNRLSVERFALYHLLSDATLRASGNLAYLKLEKENIVLRDRVDSLQYVIC